MTMMKAYRLLEWGRPPEFADALKPSPGANDVLIRMKAAGLCRSDLDIIDSDPDSGPYAPNVSAGFTLGHENAGVVEAVGSNVLDLREGDHVIAHHIHSCGYCDACLHGTEQSCQIYAAKTVPLTRGVGLDGGLAEFLVVPRHELVPIGSLDPVEIAPLSDAGVTAYRAVASVQERLRGGTTALVIGMGGLGAYGVQLLKLMTGARVFAVDVQPRRLSLAAELGADEALLSDASAAEQILDLTNGRGADVTIDFVGTDATLALAARVSRPQGRIILVGMEGGTLQVGWGLLASNCEFTISLGSTRADLYEICQLAAQGKLRIDVERFSFDAVEEAYTRLRQGKLDGRAVVTF
ncbi:MAG: NAD(P)-dependent alcohol dehydrogenase [Gammaproteobacteria bacterium]|nr:NAD(P)-dependent alcohol dehydrogenase [Gammaproteobacteria bacterium]NNM00425.1 NAD(P)-dependent alcohol dehydrogenase [Gammaproteobacteria bacterium]